MTVEKVFHVLTEFRFDVQSAVANSEALQGAVGKISDTADKALFSLTSLGNFLSSGFGVNLSVLSIAAAAIQTNEKYQKSVLSFSNIIGSNMDVLTGDVDSFNDRLAVSEKILRNVSKVAKEFSLDESAMLATTKALAPVLVRHGMAGQNFGNAIDMARMFEKSAPILGVDTNLAQGQLINSILGNASMNDTLFRRMATETKAFQGIGGSSTPGGKGSTSIAQVFNRFAPEKRFEMISKALKQFSSDADVNASMTQLLARQLQNLKNTLVGIEGILRPVGAALSQHIRPALEKLQTFLDTKGRKIAEQLGAVISSINADPEKLFAVAMQMRNLKHDLQHAGHIAHMIGLAMFVQHIGHLALKIPGVTVALNGLLAALGQFTGIAALGGGIAGLKTAMAGFMRIGTIASVGFTVLRFVLTRVLAPLALVTGLFQIISRARAYGKMIDFKALVDGSDKLIPAIVRVKEAFNKLIAPFETAFDMAARFIAPLFAISTYVGPASSILGVLADTMEFVANAALLMIAGVHGGFTVAAQVFMDIGKSLEVSVFNMKEIIVGGFGVILERLRAMFEALKGGDFGTLKSLATSPLNFVDHLNFQQAKVKTPEELAAMFNSAVDEIFANNVKTLNDPNAKDKNVNNHTTHIGKVEIYQDFKENQEPDRIAHSLVDTLKRVAINPQQSAGRSVAASMMR